MFKWEEQLIPNNIHRLYWLGSRGALAVLLITTFYIFVGWLGMSPPQSQLELTAIFTSGLLTFALIAVYRDLGETQDLQRRIMNQQRELLQHDMNREIRQKHTEVLRERVRIWLGKDENQREGSQLDLLEDSTNIPIVHWTDVESASTTGWPMQIEREEFKVIPDMIEGDRFLVDLLDNHASDLAYLVEVIELSHHEFIQSREKFLEVFEGGERREAEKYTFHPTPQFDLWAFERAVRIERDLDDKMRLAELARKGVLETTGAIQNNTILYRGEPPDTTKTVYACEPKMKEPAALTEEEKTEAEEIVVDILTHTIAEIDKHPSYEFANKAAEELDNLAALIEELEMVLIELEGRIVYSGDCKYIDEARV